MAVSDDVLDLTRLLNEAGFGAIAGELLTEIDRGRLEERPDPLGDDEANSVLVSVPYEEAEQFKAAIEMMRARLIAPARAFAEAERFASKLAGKPTEIHFVDPRGGKTVFAEGRGPIGDTTLADELDAFLVELLSGPIAELDR
ncbi:hypothetical protein GGC65_003414 [Sphingopyxis sp. OAS728]|uniref:hypothetical protein n=1 Tax=Sphingopyxis sp. OAS728 TaxID=2663823 RepID=UPI00178B3DDD|nr:hypothetical protein [Sphingopyxis sp. OAS728]MBE1528958.1 hypothetical protein [Sphingopyxis sp. OAS728]